MTHDQPFPPVLLWTAEEVAYAVAVGVEVIEAKRKAGDLKAVKIGRAWRYHPDDVQAWLDSLRPALPNHGRPVVFDPADFRTPQAGRRTG